jgi:hypothetical protein
MLLKRCALSFCWISSQSEYQLQPAAIKVQSMLGSTEGTTTGVTTHFVWEYADLRILRAFGFDWASSSKAGAAGIRQFAQVRQG